MLVRYIGSHPVHLLGAKPPLSLKPSDAPDSNNLLNVTVEKLISARQPDGLRHRLDLLTKNISVVFPCIVEIKGRHTVERKWSSLTNAPLI